MKKSRRKFTAEFKAKVAIETIKLIKTISELTQIYQVHPNLITHWKKEFLANAGKVFNASNDESEEVKKLKQENEELIHQIGQLSVDINWLKKRFYDTIGNTQGIDRQR